MEVEVKGLVSLGADNSVSPGLPLLELLQPVLRGPVGAATGLFEAGIEDGIRYGFLVALGGVGVGDDVRQQTVGKVTQQGETVVKLRHFRRLRKTRRADHRHVVDILLQGGFVLFPNELPAGVDFKFGVASRLGFAFGLRRSGSFQLPILQGWNVLVFEDNPLQGLGEVEPEQQICPQLNLGEIVHGDEVQVVQQGHHAINGGFVRAAGFGRGQGRVALHLPVLKVEGFRQVFFQVARQFEGGQGLPFDGGQQEKISAELDLPASDSWGGLMPSSLASSVARSSPISCRGWRWPGLRNCFFSVVSTHRQNIPERIKSLSESGIQVPWRICMVSPRSGKVSSFDWILGDYPRTEIPWEKLSNR